MISVKPKDSRSNARRTGQVCVYEGEPSTPKFNPAVSARDPFLDPETQERSTVPEIPTKTGCILVNTKDFLIVLNRLLKLKLAKEEKRNESTAMAAQTNDMHHGQSNLEGSTFFEEYLYCHYLQSLLKREEFKIAVELFGYRQEEITADISEQSLGALRLALEGRQVPNDRRET